MPRHIVMRLPRKVHKAQFVSMGAISWVYRITEGIVVKYARDTDAADLEVLRVEDRRLVERWAAELSAAVAWLESLGLVHADLRPPNILFDD